VPPWFAIWTRSRAEKAVYEQLDRKGVEVFLPTVPRWSRWKDRRKRIDWPLFPGYCFARFDPADSLRVLTCNGVATIVSFDGQLAPVPDAEVDAVRRLVTSDLQYDPCPFIKEGSRVEVVYGPLKGVTGLLVKKDRHAQLVLSVELIGRAVAVKVDASDVRAY
jgi:transcription antitermination factor NusG